MALDDVVDLLACPHCGARLGLAGGVLRCAVGHSFDVARQGYVTLFGPSGGGPTAGDDASMVEARERLHATGHLRPLVEAVASEAVRVADCGPVEAIVDVGAGTGTYLSATMQALQAARGIALDRSRHAARRAARCHPAVGAVVCDVWAGLPVRTGGADVLLSIFAPRNGPGMARILRRDGVLLVATPTRRHLAEVVGPLGLLSVDERKPARLEATLGASFVHAGSVTHEHVMSLGPADLAGLVAMGPSAHHVDAGEAAERIGAGDAPTEVTASVTIAAYRPAAGQATRLPPYSER